MLKRAASVWGRCNSIVDNGLKIDRIDKMDKMEIDKVVILYNVI